MVDLLKSNFWCESRVVRCKPASHNRGQAPRSEQRASDPRVGAHGTVSHSAAHAGAHHVARHQNLNPDAQSEHGSRTRAVIASLPRMPVVRHSPHPPPATDVCHVLRAE